MFKVKWFKLVTVSLIIVGLFVFLSATAQQKVVKIGAFAPISGPYADIGGQIKRGIELAVELQNQKGGIEIDGTMYPIKLIWNDTESKVEVALSVIDKAVTVDNIDIAVGFLHSHLFLPSMEKFQSYEVPVVDAAAASTKIYQGIKEKNLTYVFQNSPTTDDIGAAVTAAAVHYMKPKKVGLVNEDTDAGRDFGRVSRDWIEENAPDVEIVYDGYLKAERTEFTAELAKMKGTGAEVLIGELYGASASGFTEQWYNMQVPALPAWMGATINSEEFINEHQEELEGTIVNNRWWPGPYTEISEFRLNAYREKYNREPTNFAIQAHDATLIAIQAIDAADSLDKEAIRDELDENVFTCIWGLREFTPDTHRVPTDMVVVQIQDGEKVVIWPLILAEKLPGEWMPVPPWPWEK